MEIWKPIANFSNYEASNLGRIRNKTTQTISDFRTLHHGFIRGQLVEKGKRIEIRVHCIIAETFLEIKFENYQIIHKDGNKLNNKSDNLEIIKKNKIIVEKKEVNLNYEELLNKYKIILNKKEKYLPIQDFPYYIITSEGRIFNLKTGKKQEPYLNPRGFLQITFSDKQKKTYLVHMLVVNYFKPNNKEQVWHVVHKNGNKLDNNVDNLDWVKYSKDKVEKPTWEELSKENEIWKEIVNYSDYKVSNLGRVIHIKKMKIKEVKTHKTGYVRVTIKNEQRKTKFLVHRLVAISFIENPDKKRYVNHINGKKADNRLENLEWSTASENVKHAIRTGLLKISVKKKGRMIEKLNDNKNVIKTYNSIQEAAKKNNLTSDRIKLDCKKGTNKTGFYWRYAQNNNSLEGEEWKTIVDYPNYQISSMGRIKNNKSDIMRPSITNGYYGLNLFKDGLSSRHSIHVLVAKAFLPNTHPENLDMVNHKNGNKLDNNLSNLEWYNNSLNIIHAYETGLFVPHKCKVRQLSLEGEFIKEWDSIIEASRALKINDPSISSVCKGKRKTSGGFKWEYIN